MKTITMLTQRICPIVLICLTGQLTAGTAMAENPEGTGTVDFFGYADCIELKNSQTRVVLCWQAGGRVLEYSVDGVNAIYLDDKAQGVTDQTGVKGSGMTGGRFDIGPEKIQPRREVLWQGRWKGEIVGPRRARLTSQEDEVSGFQVIRDFQLDAESSHLACKQTFINISDSKKQVCHWSRTFAQGNGICVVPTTPFSRFPNGWVMYETPSLIDYRPQDDSVRELDRFLIIDGPTANPKLGFDSMAGWLAYLTPNDLMFVKRYKTYPNRAYNEVAGLTLSIWYPEQPMVEIEPIGPREVLAPGEQASFTEHWYLKPHDFPASTNDVDPANIKQIANSLFEDQ